jgi:hypothetical protein
MAGGFHGSRQIHGQGFRGHHFGHRFLFGPGIGDGFYPYYDDYSDDYGDGYPYAYYPYASGDSYAESDGCHVVKRHVHTTHGWRWQSAQVCG